MFIRGFFPSLTALLGLLLRGLQATISFFMLAPR
jgi:hypothetical protein